MTGSPKKKPPKGRGEINPDEQSQKRHQANLANASVIIKHAISTVLGTGVSLSLIKIQETVQHWPTLLDKSDPNAFTPPFNATEISAEKSTKDNDMITSVSFTYQGNVYDFVSRIEKTSPSDDTAGIITLHENGERVISMEILQKQGQERFNFHELNVFKPGTWIERIVEIGAEIEQHNMNSG